MTTRNASPTALAFLVAAGCAGACGIGIKASNALFHKQDPVGTEMAMSFVVARTVWSAKDKLDHGNPKP